MHAIRIALGAVACALVFAAPAWGAEVATPTVEGPIEGGLRGHPWNKSLFDLAEHGYTEREYFFGGTAGDLGTGLSAPYRSRMLVRAPRDPKRFNGTFVVEWLNVTGQTDLETVWPPAGEYLMEQGAAYVGVSAQMVGVCCGPLSLKGWDPQRYATLLHPGDGFSFDIFSQAIQALRAQGEGADPTGRVEVEHIVATGASQSAGRLTSYINQGYTRGGVDVFNITRGGGPFEDFSVPIFQLNEEGLEDHHPDSGRYRLWEEAGTAHAPKVWWDYVWRMQMQHGGVPGAPDAVGTACSINRGRVDYSARALAHAIQRYLDDGVLPPRAPRIERDAAGEVVRDEHGLAVGGLRHPFVEVPVAYNGATGCPLYGTYEAWSAEEIRALYPTHAAYVRKVRRWADHEVRRGWLLRADRDDAVREAQRLTAPWR
jgi:Alpha/beta hydrolase domain